MKRRCSKRRKGFWANRQQYGSDPGSEDKTLNDEKGVIREESAELPLSLVKSIPSTCRHLMFRGPRKVLMSP